MPKQRRHFTADEKVATLRRHLLDKVPVSDLCDELNLNPNVFYAWQKAFFENGAAAFAGRKDSTSQKLEARRGNHPAARPRKLPGVQAQDHLRQRPAVHRQRLQGFHQALRNDARAHLAELPVEQR